MGVKFASGGFLTTVQDMGRTGYQESGMSVSGVMDRRRWPTFWSEMKRMRRCWRLLSWGR